MKRVDSGEGILILTDMFGGTPSNISLSFLEEGKVEVVTGVNLPMLIKLVTYRQDKTLSDLANFIANYGRKEHIPCYRCTERQKGGVIVVEGNFTH